MSAAQRRSVILGTGSELPTKVVTNRDLEKMVETSDEWITVRTGIKERRVLEEGKRNADMAFRAARRALDDAGVEPNDLDAIIMEYAWLPVVAGPATITIVGTGGGSTITTDYLDAGAGIPTLNNWATTK